MKDTKKMIKELSFWDGVSMDPHFSERKLAYFVEVIELKNNSTQIRLKYGVPGNNTNERTFFWENKNAADVAAKFEECGDDHKKFIKLMSEIEDIDRLSAVGDQPPKFFQ